MAFDEKKSGITEEAPQEQTPQGYIDSVLSASQQGAPQAGRQRQMGYIDSVLLQQRPSYDPVPHPAEGIPEDTDDPDRRDEGSAGSAGDSARSREEPQTAFQVRRIREHSDPLS